MKSCLISKFLIFFLIVKVKELQVKRRETVIGLVLDIQEGNTFNSEYIL